MSNNQWNDQPNEDQTRAFGSPSGEYHDEDFDTWNDGSKPAEVPPTSMFPPQGAQDARPKQQFPDPQHAQPQYVPPAQPQYVPAPAGYAAPQRSNTGLIVLIVLLVLALFAIGGWYIWQSNHSSSTAPSAAEDPATVVTTVTPGREDSRPSAAEATPSSSKAPKERPANPALPSDAVAVSNGAKLGRQSGSLDNVWKSGPTSDQFAMAVAKEFTQQYRRDRNTSPTLEVASSVTGETYRMTCTDNGSYVHCRGGNNANVYIA